MPPFTFGMYLSAVGFVDDLFQVLFVARPIDLFGAKVFRRVKLVYFLLVALFLVMTLIVQ